MTSGNCKPGPGVEMERRCASGKTLPAMSAPACSSSSSVPDSVYRLYFNLGKGLLLPSPPTPFPVVLRTVGGEGAGSVERTGMGRRPAAPWVGDVMYVEPGLAQQLRQSLLAGPSVPACSPAGPTSSIFQFILCLSSRSSASSVGSAVPSPGWAGACLNTRRKTLICRSLFCFQFFNSAVLLFVKRQS